MLFLLVWCDRLSRARRSRRARRNTAKRVKIPAKARAPFYANLRLFYIIGIVALVGMLIPSICVYRGGIGSSRTKPQSDKSYTEPPPMTIDAEKSYRATIETDKGNIKLELYPKEAPKTVNNFVFLARDGFYDGLTFHRVISGAFAQAGDPLGDGSGGPGYAFEDEPNSLVHLEGTVSMANRGANTNGSQFFICYTAQPQLDGLHTIFGKVVEGMDVLAKLTPRDPSQAPAYSGDVIRTIVIEES